MVGMFRFYFCDFQDGSHNHLWLWNPSGSAGKESTCNAGHPSSILGFRKIPWRRHRLPTPVFLGFSGGSAGKESTCSVGFLGWIPGLGRSPGEGKGYPLQYSGLENPMDCTVKGVTKSQTRLSIFHYAVLECGVSEFGCAVNVKYTLDSKYLEKNMQNILAILLSVLHVNILEIL